MRNKIDGIFEILERKNPSEIIKLALKLGNIELMRFVLKNCSDIDYDEFANALADMVYKKNIGTINNIVEFIDLLGVNAAAFIDIVIAKILDGSDDLENYVYRVKNPLFMKKVEEYLDAYFDSLEDVSNLEEEYNAKIDELEDKKSSESMNSKYDLTDPNEFLNYCINNKLSEYINSLYNRFPNINLSKIISYAINHNGVRKLIDELSMHLDKISVSVLEDIAIQSYNIGYLYIVAALEGANIERLLDFVLSIDCGNNIDSYVRIAKNAGVLSDEQLDKLINSILTKTKGIKLIGGNELCYACECLQKYKIKFNVEKMFDAVLSLDEDMPIVNFLTSVKGIDFIKYAAIYRKYSDRLDAVIKVSKKSIVNLQKEFALNTDLFQDFYNAVCYVNYTSLDTIYLTEVLGVSAECIADLIEIVRKQLIYEQYALNIEGIQDKKELYRKSGRLDEFISVLENNNVPIEYIEALRNKYYGDDINSITSEESSASPKVREKKDQH